MILKKEIERIAEGKGVAKSTIDKDWALGHFLAAIFSEPELKDTLIFKGGTCLKKCYFSDYRFSEDLDFTSRTSEFELKNLHLDFICQHVNENAGILSHTESLLPLRFKNNLAGYEAIIKFWGADHPRNEVPPAPDRWHTKIKIEVTLYEKLIFANAAKVVIHPYSDKISLGQDAIPCYGFEEMLSEKLRSLIQRSYTAPRDYFDIWYLSTHIKDLNWSNILLAFLEKMKFKGHAFTGIEQFFNDDNDKKLNAAWKNSLEHQIPGGKLPSYEEVKEKLMTLLNENLELMNK
jgi:predicted nucleotidyltransferase component of viral defense system